MSLRIIGILSATGALAVAGCGGGGGGQTGTAQKPDQAKDKAASTGLKQPDAKVSFTDVTTTPGTVTAKVDVSGVKLSPNAVGKAAAKGQGHLHFAMDEGKYDFPKYSGANGQLAVKLGVQGKYSPSVMPTITYKNLPPGEHTLEVYVANNDHSNTGAEAKTTLTLK